ncbi:MAG TPA: hypothetical protein VIT23_06490, partial [Terrimicrobiaceae bacterium]
VAIGLALCILGGRLAARANTFADRSRFFYQISPEGYVYPTLENLLQFVRERAAHDKILILSAGSSISLGVGQQNGHLWTNLLQTELGDQFSVVNLSFRSAKFTSIGLPIMEILSREYPRLLFVTETRPGYAPDWMQYDFGSYAYPYNYLMVQAWLSGKLLSNPIRDEKVREALQSADELTQLRAREDLIRALLEKVTSASDLWNYLSYKYFFTVFSPVQSPNFPFWVPRSELPDDESFFVFDPEGLKAREAHELRILKGAYVERVGMAQNKLQLSDIALQSFAAIEKAIPDLTLRARTLFLVTTRNPVLTEQLSSTDWQRYQLSVFDWSQKLNQAGFATLSVGMNYQGEDFIDAHHFSNKGGARMASEIAPIIRQMAEKNGWLDQTIK